MIDFEKLGKLWGENFALIGYGALSTLILSILGTLFGLILGIFLAYGKNVKIKSSDKAIMKALKGICLAFCNVYSVLLRGAPMMVQALLFKFGCSAIGINWGNIYFEGEINNVFNGWMFAGLIVITFNTAAASVLPPARPAETGIFFSIFIFTPSTISYLSLKISAAL